MNVQQEILPYNPITIKLEKRKEATRFLAMMNKLDRVDEQSVIDLTVYEKDILTELLSKFNDFLKL